LNARDPDGAATQAACLEPAQAQGDEDETLAASAAALELEPRPAQTAGHAGAPSRYGQRPLIERDPDADLVARVGARDTGAVRTLVASKLPRLLALATRMLGDRMEAEDVAQETFVRIWKEAPHWRTGEAKFDTWVHRVVLNLCYDRLRGRRDEPSDTLPDTPDPDAPPDQRIETRSRDERVRAALTALPSRQREALVLTYYQELSNQQASDLMGISVDALESLLARARRTLRAQLAGERAGKDSA
jgi:RNA polymerase sigma-70 factor (ECF subfamily)